MLTVDGRVTETCGGIQPLTGYRVDVRVRVGFGPFASTTSSASATVGADGSYAVTVPVSGALAMLALLKVTVTIASAVTGGVVAITDRRLWLGTSNHVQIDVGLNQCVTQSTPIRVVMGAVVSGAEVFVNGIRRGVTGDGVAPGLLFLSPPLAIGDSVVARKLVWERQTDRTEHSGGSTQNWNYRVYVTSAPLEHDPQTGDNPTLRPTLVTDPFAEHVLTLSRTNPLIGFHLRMSVEWDSSPATLSTLRDALRIVSDGLFNATDGQMFLERVELTDDKTFWDTCDLRVYANLNLSSQANGFALLGSGGFIHLNRGDAPQAGVVVHEFGHYGLNLGDEYKSGGCWADARDPGCTEASRVAGGAYGSMGAKASCVMGDSRRMTKLCSTHPDNPHVRCTHQGESSCWETVLSNYADSALISRWVLRGPTQRSVIVGPLTVPLQGWQTDIPIANRQRPGACGDLRVRFTYQGANINGLKVYLHTTYGNLLWQGKTNVWPAQGLGDGEAWIVGAHVGDEITAFGLPLYGRHTITATECAAALVTHELSALPFTIWAAVGTSGTGLRVELRSGAALVNPPALWARLGTGGVLRASALRRRDAEAYEVDLPAPRGMATVWLEAAAQDAHGREAKCIVAASIGTVEKNRDAVLSADGSLRVETDGSHGRLGIVIADARDDTAMLEPQATLVGPYRVTTARGEHVSTPIQVTLQLDPAVGPLRGDQSHIDILRFDERTRRWVGLGAHADASGMQYTASPTDLGLFVLARHQT